MPVISCFPPVVFTVYLNCCLDSDTLVSLPFSKFAPSFQSLFTRAKMEIIIDCGNDIFRGKRFSDNAKWTLSQSARHQVTIGESGYDCHRQVRFDQPDLLEKPGAVHSRHLQI